jgi:hypothetical protein
VTSVSLVTIPVRRLGGEEDMTDDDSETLVIEQKFNREW